jgi:hypothetical protein
MVPVHYSHDKDKDDEWRLSQIEKYKTDRDDWQGSWDREMEMDFSSVSGASAYHYTMANLLKGLEYSVSLPLCLTMDFNVEPCLWEVAQIVRGLVCFIDEIRISPASIEDMVREFRNRYPAHQGELWIYGDATGNGRSPQTKKSCYDLVRLYLRGYPATQVWKVPAINPPVIDRVNAFNLKMRGVDGMVGVLIDPDKCPELVRDLKEVVIAKGQIVKTKKREDPYFYRTHASDSGGYLIFREWPVIKALMASTPKRRAAERRYKQVLGAMR